MYLHEDDVEQVTVSTGKGDQEPRLLQKATKYHLSGRTFYHFRTFIIVEGD